MEDIDGRVRKVEAGQERLEGAVADIKREAHETRVEHGTILKTIASEVRSISEKQIGDARFAEGVAAAATVTAKGAESRARWFVPLSIGLLLAAIPAVSWIAEHFVQDQQPQEINATIEDAR